VATNRLWDAESLAVDGSGNLFAANYDGIYEILAVNGAIPANPTINTILSGTFTPFSTGYGSAVDASGDVYFVDENVGEVKEILAVNGVIPSTPTVTVLASAFGQPSGLAVDGNGNVFVADQNQTEIVEIQRSAPPSFTFASTNVGSTSSDSPQSVTVQNIGNANLTGTNAFSLGTNFSLISLGETPPDCTSSFSLASGAECNLGLSFIPQASGLLSDTFTLTDNALNATAATQMISLSGTGSLLSPPLAQVSATLNFPNIAFPGSETLPLTITNIGGGTLTFTAAINGPSYKGVPGGTCAGSLAANANCTLQIEFLPTAVGTHSEMLTLETNGSSNPVVNLSGTATGVVATVTSLQFGSIAFGTTETLSECRGDSASSGSVLRSRIHPSRWKCTVSSAMQPAVQIGKLILQPGFILRPSHSIHPGCSFALQRAKAVPQEIDGDMVEQSGEQL